ncbi:MAG TPA: efflux RND transporter periplasmic adaptor subunit [Vicinamibacterales bacterium]|nr:efflux RND transporter periplasmic adaptor subunit [Vicinamibacterales bacterium]
MHRIPALLSAAVISISVLSAGCAAEDAAATANARGGGRGGGAAVAVPVTVAQVVQKSMPIEITVIGAAEPYSSVSIRSQITGQMTAVNFTEGDDVKAGQVLFALDRRPLEAALEQAKANLDRDIAQAANAEAQFKRFQELADRGIATKEQVDTARTSMTALNATVNADRAALENAQVQLQYATITATISGRTGALQVHEGNLVRANDQTPLVVINQIAPISVTFAIPEARLPELKRYMARGALRVTATPPKDEAPPAVGRISFVDNQVDQTTGTIKLKGTFPNDDRRLWPGQFLNVTVTLTNETTAIVVPTAAVQTGQQGQYVFVVKDDRTVEMRSVVVSRTSAAETVLANGVKPGETVVTDGHLRLVPGSLISVKGAGRAEEPVSTKGTS